MIVDKTPQSFYKKAFYLSLLLRVSPFVRLVAVSGSVAKNSHDIKSDIDFWIVAKNNRLWTCRAFVLGLTQILGLRVDFKNQKMAGRACFNCFQTEDNLKVNPQAKRVALDYSQLYILWYSDNLVAHYLFANKWMLKFTKKFNLKTLKPNFWLKLINLVFCAIQFVSEFIYDLFLSSWGEEKLTRLQQEKMKNNYQKNRWPTKKLYFSRQEVRTHW
jgi:predicted nucleotidyltransferase